jgi:DNA polymerase-4
MPSRFVCLRVAHLPVLVEDLHSPGSIQQPCVIVRAWDGRVVDASPAALASGVDVGDGRARVEQLCPQAVVLPARETLYQSYHDRLHAVLATFSTAVETVDLGEFFIEIGALARTFPSEQALGEALVTQACQASGLPAVVGIAGNKFTAQQAAAMRSAAPGGTAQPRDDAASQANLVRVVSPGQERAFLAPLPLTVLPQPPAELLRRLYLFGITTLGDFARLPRSAIAQQFGASQVVFYDLASGSDPRPLVPATPPPMITTQRTLPEPLDNRQLLLIILERLAAGLARHLSQAGYHAMALALVVTTVDGQELTSGTPVKPPSSDPALLERLAGRLLGRLAPTMAVAGLTLTAYPLREWHLGAQQLTLVDEPAAGRWQRLQATLRILWQRFGSAMIRLASTVGPPLPIPLEVQTRPDGTPLVVRWGGWGRLVDEVHEYWREERQWWDQVLRREYFQVITEDDTILTLFRDDNERWFLDRRRV